MTLFVLGPPVAQLATSHHQIVAGVFDNVNGFGKNVAVPIVATIAGLVIVFRGGIAGKHEHAKKSTLWTVVGLAIAVAPWIYYGVANDATKQVTGSFFLPLMLPSGALTREGVRAYGRRQRQRAHRLVRWVHHSSHRS